MWNLNDSPDHHEESDSRVGHVSNWMSPSAMWLPPVPPVTRNFFPGQSKEPGVQEMYGSGFTRSQSVGMSDPSGSGRPEELVPEISPPPIKKSRRGPRSRSSQYRGVTFYRRTGRWESHIW